ncbi:hypothetical protein GO013_12835 [Pseudodesulfovibrio sp. JC047]|uniref:hypothetical protein n=1 Tax=Pseudodesulfovibrio sp. JC047 TaxID=2683199 RepID=UPI0013D41AB2|nr:hypothetical protein [Pseudodesulfovibrio sp. JC047]NDV20294.1 hypothetical protein [Pseudodesulfovibrio sp. JC047]
MTRYRFSGLTWAVVTVILVSATMSVLLGWQSLSAFFERGILWNGSPLIGNNDGYYYLEQARRLAQSGTSFSAIVSDVRQSMLLPYTLAAIAGNNVELLHCLSLYAGPVLGFSMLLAVLPWAVETRSIPVILVSGPLAMLAPYWLLRSQVGFLDTDTLVPGLCLYALYCVFKFSTQAVKRWPWALLYLGVLLVTWFWWRPGAFLIAGYLVCYVAYPRYSSFDRVAKVVLLGCGLCVLGLLLAGYDPVVKQAAYLVEHINLAFGGVSKSLLSDAIIELGAVGPWGIGTKSLGSPILLFPALVGTVGYCVRYKWKALFLASAWIFGGASMLSQRFIPLFVPVAAFFTVYGVFFVGEWGIHTFAARWKAHERTVQGLLTVVCASVLFWGVSNAASYRPVSYFTRGDFILAQKISQDFPSDTVIWTWWDFGYFYRYLTGMKTFFDGGSQTDLSCFTAAYPLMQPDMRKAALWMKHFAVASPNELDLRHKGTGWPEAVARFNARLAQTPRKAAPSVALCLPARVYTTVGYLYAFAHVFDEHIPPVVNQLDLFPKDGFQYDPASNAVVVPEMIVNKGYDSFGRVIDATGKTPDLFDFGTLPDPYLVHSAATNFLAVATRPVVRSVLFRLLGLFEGDTTTFEPFFFEYDTGGVWRVH